MSFTKIPPHNFITQNHVRKYVEMWETFLQYQKAQQMPSLRPPPRKASSVIAERNANLLTYNKNANKNDVNNNEYDTISEKSEENFTQLDSRPNTISDSKVDATFRKITKNSICFHVWKIDDDRLEAEQRANFGTFYNDAAYIVYAAGPVGTYVNQDTINRESKTNVPFERFIHFWLGSKVSEQKRSNVAHKVQELDSHLDNVAVQYREAEDNESARFLAYFKNGITVRSGAQTTSNDQNHLYQVRGHKFLRCIEMDTISWSHFGAEYIMLLKTPIYTFLWFGRSASTEERLNALKMLEKIARNPTEITIVDDGYEKSMSEERKQVWSAFLPLSQKVVQQQTPLPVRQFNSKMRIYKCGHKNSRLHLEQLDVVFPSREDFSDSTTSYVLDAHPLGVWIWVGKDAPKEDKTSAMGNGRAFVKKKQYAYATQVIRVVEGFEPIEFIRLFPTWNSDLHEFNGNLKATSKNIGKIDRVLLAQRPKMAAEMQLIDDGSGEREIYQLLNDTLLEMQLNKIKVLMFYTNCCYVIIYKVAQFPASMGDEEIVGVDTIIYQWNGAEASTSTVNRCEQFARGLLMEEHPKSMYVQMAEFDETPHFLQMFNGKLIVRHSPANRKLVMNGNGVACADLPTSLTASDSFILKIYGNAPYNAKASEVYIMSEMNAKDCYVLSTPQHVWVWCSQCSTGDTREIAKRFGCLLGESSLVLEGNEPQEFWNSTAHMTNKSLFLSGTNNFEYLINSSVSSLNTSSPSLLKAALNGSLSSLTANNTAYRSPALNGSPGKSRILAQLYVVWSQRGKFYAREIVGYEQSDLSPEAVYLVDAGYIAYIWWGASAPKQEREAYLQILDLYAELVPIARRATTAFAIVRQGSEPNTFVGLFEHWDRNYWKTVMDYRQKRKELSGLAAQKTNGHSNGNDCNESIPDTLYQRQREFDQHIKYPINVLQQEVDLLPPEVNPLTREQHLSNDDFVSLFEMQFYEFDALPSWKKQELKKKHKLF